MLFLLVKFRAWLASLVVEVIFDSLFEDLNDDLALDGLTFMNGNPPVILEEIGQFEFGDAQHVRFKRAAN